VYNKILVPMDGSKPAEEALRHAEYVAYELSSSLLLLRVVKPPRSVEHPWPEEMMALNREREGVDLIAMPTHGRSGVSRWVYGSVTDKVLQGATCPVLFVRTTRRGAT
jgi:nucleotide-binding universal stress UspA family protein